ncbi:hypothetical protein PF011_g17889 [Phytophthora fragariae]|uniref:ZSWIM1/3 RNaseH-like domain-containing protein n=1 Tax=Phytophthora fragariae TaxID=53985 RepID=A0A6A3JHR6_9STRA|nr:hypothetical protein PF011_g17889 [Phytophthora fragariae]
MSRAGAKPKEILAYLRAKTGKRTVLQDVHNMIQDAKKRFDPGSTDGDRALKVLDEFCEGTPGNTAEFVLDSGSGVVRVVTFQSARMQRSFAAFPEVVLVDSTHDTKSNRYKLFSFAIHDVFGRGQYVQHALVIAEEKPNLAIAVVTFNKNNPAWTKIRVVMTDKAFHEKDGLADAWPKARQLLCKWHVETWLKKQCSRLGGVGMLETKQLKDIMKGLVNAESQQEYDDLKVAFLSTVRDDVDNLLNKSFMTHWDTTTEEWGIQPEPKHQENCAEEEGTSARVTIVFASPPRRRGLTRRAERKDESTREMREAKRIMARVREGKNAVVVNLAHMAALSGPYCSSTEEPFLDKLNLPSVEVTGSQELRRFNIGKAFQ